jgi:hypothetical protein
MPTIPEYVQAINDASGLITVAARRLNVAPRPQLYKARQKHPQIAQAIEDARERMTDLAEGKLYSKINEGDMTAIIFYLKTQGKKRGYVERQEIEAQVTQGRFMTQPSRR